jgi:hypothetical protein
MPRLSLFDGILVGNKGTINNTQMRNFNFRVVLNIPKNSNCAISNDTIKEALDLCTQQLMVKDYHIPFSYVRMEIDPEKSTQVPHNKIIMFGTSDEPDYFDDNLDISTLSYDYIYLHQSMDTVPIDKILLKSSEKFKITFANNFPKEGQVELKITMYYHYLGGDF